MKKIFACFLVCAALTGCATYQPTIPPGYTGPTAKVFDGGVLNDRTQGTLFYIDSIDGQPIYNSLKASRSASSGMGPYLSMVYLDYMIPARPMKVKLVGTHATSAPISEMASRAAGTFFSVEGEVTFSPKPGHIYLVTGSLEKDKSSVWIVDSDAETVPVTEIVTSKKK